MADGATSFGRIASPIGHCAHTDANYTVVQSITVPVTVDGYVHVKYYFWGGTATGTLRSGGEGVGIVSVDAGVASVSAYTNLEQKGDAGYDFKIAMSGNTTLQLQAKTANGGHTWGWLEIRGGELAITP